VVATEKEIGNLITLEDFENLALKNVKERVIIPGMVLAHDRDIHRALRRDGKRRLVFRGPDELTVVSEISIYNTLEEVLEKEIEAFTGLITQINDLGSIIPEFYAGKKHVQEGCLSSEHFHSHSSSRDRAVQASENERIELIV